MTNTVTDLDNWPTRHSGQPILKSTNEAFLYAQLIHNDPKKQADLVRHREDTYAMLKLERETLEPDPQAMMDLSVRAQLFREAFMEVLRINNEPYHISRG